MLKTALAVLLILAPAHAIAGVTVDDRDAARAWIDTTFATQNCRISRAGFFDLMAADGLAPTVEDMSLPMDGSLKILRQRRVLAELKTLFDAGLVCEDIADRTIAVSKFGGCAG